MDEPTVNTPTTGVHQSPVRLRDGLAYAAGAFVTMRLVLSVSAVLSVGTVSPTVSEGSGADVPARPGLHNVVDGPDRWDAGWFKLIARQGYASDDASAAFFPGYPLAIRLITEVAPIGEFGAGTIVSNTAFFGALVVVFALTAREYSYSLARRTVVLLACFPVSFFFFAPYSESLYLLFTALAFWWVRGERWRAGGAAGFAGALTRSLGVMLAPALLVEALGPTGRRRRLPIACAIAPIFAPVLYSLYWFARSGDFLRAFHAQDAWLRTLQAPPVTLGNALWLGILGITSPRGIYWTADLLLTGIMLAPLAFRWRLLARSYLVYSVGTILVVLSYPLPARPLLSAPRLLLVVFPMFWVMADAFTHRVFVVAVGVFTLLFIALSIAFMNWGFVF
jgi:hypothetical protein